MNTYHLMFGIDPMAMFIMPILFDTHPDEMPRFNDAKIKLENKEYIIEILSRIGKKYHGHGMGEQVYLDHPLFLRFEDALLAEFEGTEFRDDTYGRYYFRIPEDFYNDILLIYNEKKPHLTSGDFKVKVLNMYPRLHKQLTTLFTKGFMI